MFTTISPDDLIVSNLGPRRIRSPLPLGTNALADEGRFVRDAARVLLDIERFPNHAAREDLLVEKAGPRQHIFFDPRTTKAAIVTCGGLCPGLNNVIRSVYVELHFNYGVPEVWGIRNGYQGFDPAKAQPPIRLTLEMVDHVHQQGGTMLGSSRGPEDPAVVVDFLQRANIQLLFCVGGDGTQRGARQIAAEARRRGLAVAVVGIPKTIDNDLPLVNRSFGFSTAMEKRER